MLESVLYYLSTKGEEVVNDLKEKIDMKKIYTKHAKGLISVALYHRIFEKSQQL